MWPEVSLAIRAFLALLAAILASTSLPTRAQELQFDLTAQARTQNTNVPVGPFDSTQRIPRRIASTCSRMTWGGGSATSGHSPD